MSGRPAHNPALHRVALLTAAATFPLIFMGGLVTSHGAGMSVPDWPNSYGYNMFTFPPSQWVGGILYEHTHRLMGTVVGACSTLLFLVAWGWGRNAVARFRLAAAGVALGLVMIATLRVPFVRGHHLTELFAFAAFVLIGSALCRNPEPRRWVRWLATAVLAGVIVQGVLGGLRVVMVELDLAIVHACFAQAFFCLAVLTAVVTSRWWNAAPDLSRVPAGAPGRRLTALAAACVLAIYAQLVVGATMRHYDAGLAIPDLPLSYGKLLPPADAAGLASANAARAWDSGLKPVTLAQVWLHFGHRLGAVVVTVLAVALVAAVVRRHRREPALLRPALLLSGLLAIQVTLGVLTVLWRKPADVASAHVAVGALVLVTTFALTVRVGRLYLRRTAATQGFEVRAGDEVRGRPGGALAAVGSTA
jgi:cytochrome c oxidase assembly protein subunit 15